MADSLVLSVKKALTLLDILVFEDVDRQGVGLFDLSRRIGQKPSTLHCILKTMMSCGYAQQTGKSRYVAGPKCAEIAAAGEHRRGSVLVERITPLLRDLSERLNESLVLAVNLNGNRVPFLRIEDRNLVRVDVSADASTHIYECPTGRILVAFADDFLLGQTVSRWGYPGARWADAGDAEALEQARADVRNQGSIMMTDPNSTLHGFATPLKDASGRVRYALGCYAPAFRCDTDKQSVILHEIRATAQSLEHLIC